MGAKGDVGMSRLVIVPITLAEANAFIALHHRHNKPVVGHKFSIACAKAEEIVGVAIVGRPIARHVDDGWTLEVTRVCTDGTFNAPSMLYGACCRAAFALGYRRLITYTLQSESGASLRASGWKVIGRVAAKEWHRHSRPRVTRHTVEARFKWEQMA